MQLLHNIVRLSVNATDQVWVTPLCLHEFYQSPTYFHLVLSSDNQLIQLNSQEPIPRPLLYLSWYVRRAGQKQWPVA